MKFEEFMQSAFGADWKDGTYDISDMKAVFEAGCHSDVHTDNSKVIELLSKRTVQLQNDNGSQRDVIHQQYEQIQEQDKRIKQMKLDVKKLVCDIDIFFGPDVWDFAQKKLFDRWDKEDE